MEEKMIAGS